MMDEKNKVYLCSVQKIEIKLLLLFVKADISRRFIFEIRIKVSVAIGAIAGIENYCFTPTFTGDNLFNGIQFQTRFESRFDFSTEISVIFKLITWIGRKHRRKTQIARKKSNDRLLTNRLLIIDLKRKRDTDYSI